MEVTNNRSWGFPIPGLYVTVRPGQTVCFDRSGEYVATMKSLHKAAEAGDVRLRVYYAPEDIAAGHTELPFEIGVEEP